MSGRTRDTGFGAARALAPDDRVDRDDGAVVLVGTSVVRLSVLAAALLDACAGGWTDPADLADGLVTRFGRAEFDAEAATRALLVRLADEGLVELR